VISWINERCSKRPQRQFLILDEEGKEKKGNDKENRKTAAHHPSAFDSPSPQDPAGN